MLVLVRLVAGFAVSGKALEAVHAAEEKQIQATPGGRSLPEAHGLTGATGSSVREHQRPVPRPRRPHSITGPGYGWLPPWTLGPGMQTARGALGRGRVKDNGGWPAGCRYAVTLATPSRRARQLRA